MILWLLRKQQRRYFYLVFVIVALDVYFGPRIVAWQLEILKRVMEG